MLKYILFSKIITYNPIQIIPQIIPIPTGKKPYHRCHIVGLLKLVDGPHINTEVSSTEQKPTKKSPGYW